MAKHSKKSFLDFFKLNDTEDEYDDDLFDEDDEYDEDDDLDEDYDDDDDFEEEEEVKPAKTYTSKPASSFTSAFKKTQAKPERPQSAPTVTRNNVVSINNRRNVNSIHTVKVVKPEEFDDAQDVVVHLKEDMTIVLNVEGLEVNIAQRIIDFVAGACYAVDGTLQAISGSIFIAAPNNIDVSGDIRDEILNEASASLNAPSVGGYY